MVFFFQLIFLPESSVLAPVCVFVRTLLHVQNNPLASRGAVGANAPGMPAAPEPQPADATRHGRNETFQRKCQLVRFWVWGFF